MSFSLEYASAEYKSWLVCDFIHLKVNRSIDKVVVVVPETKTFSVMLCALNQTTEEMLTDLDHLLK